MLTPTKHAKSTKHYHLVLKTPSPSLLLPTRQNHVLIAMCVLNYMEDVNILYVLLATMIGATSVDNMNTLWERPFARVHFVDSRTWIIEN
mmetsp:Transcript_8103/g.14718  ORF Transcript_8103/g.14718 Transcript_8103/m.14718 type:complete len:90 (-) Transcript_8103:80-349(-)